MHAMADHDPVRPGIQLLVDLWHVQTTGGSLLIAAPTADLAERWAVHSIISSGQGFAPAVKSVTLATSDEIEIFIDSVAILLGIQPGPIPPDVIDDAARKLGPLRLSTYRMLTERDTDDVSELPTVAAAARLEVPPEYRVDWPRLRFMLRNFTWIAGWLVVAFLPILLGSVYWLGAFVGWWPRVGFDASESLWGNRDAVVLSVLTPVLSLWVLWGLAWFIGTHDALFARFNMWPDRGGEWSRDLGAR